MDPALVTWIVGGLLVVAVLALLIVAFAVRARLARAHRVMREAWAPVDEHLRRRHELVAALVEATPGSDDLARLRARAVSAADADRDAPSERRVVAEEDLRLAVVEAAATHRGEPGLRPLLRHLADVDDHVAAARRDYNVSVRSYDAARASGVGPAVAAVFGLGRGRAYRQP